MRSFSLLLGAFWLLSAPSAHAASYVVDPSTSAVTFQAIGSPGFLHVDGSGAKVTGGADGVFTVPLDDLKTGIELRDHHMKEKYLETAKYPVATLKVSPLPASGTWTGLLTLHGVTKPVTGEVNLTPQGSRMAVVAKFPLKLSAFAIGVPSWLGVTVAEDVTVQVSFVADPSG